MMSVIIEEEVTQSDVEILVRYLYEASKYRDQDQIKAMSVYLNNGNSYSITLADGKATQWKQVRWFLSDRNFDFIIGRSKKQFGK